jgi:PIN domain nuclease of toxin-antitoxin system
VNDGVVIADASAILALLKQEPFGKLDPRRLFRATISAVNLSEVLERLCSGGLSETEADETVATLNLQVADFDEPQARLAAYLRRRTRRAGLSLGDRACLALGLRLGRPVVTADRVWVSLNVGVEVVMIR